MLPSWCRDTVTVLRARLATRNGREVRDWASPESTTVPGCSLQPSSTETSQDGTQRNASASTAALYMPYGTDVREGDRIVAGGRTWQVEGVPLGTASPFGGASNLRVALSEWRG